MARRHPWGNPCEWFWVTVPQLLLEPPAPVDCMFLHSAYSLGVRCSNFRLCVFISSPTQSITQGQAWGTEQVGVLPWEPSLHPSMFWACLSNGCEISSPGNLFFTGKI